MSYDVMLFDANSAPRERAVFDSWFNTLTQWEGDLDYNDYTHATPALQSFYKELIKSYPSVNYSRQILRLWRELHGVANVSL